MGMKAAILLEVGLRTCRGRTAPHLIFWDEPDVGASRELCKGMGIYLAKELQEIPPHTKAVFITTHSADLVAELLPLRPQVVFVGQGYPSVEAWMNRPVEALDLGEFQKKCRDLFQRVQTFMKKT